jgi:ABC-type uncharacterized transport system substrate-binding protein
MEHGSEELAELRKEVWSVPSWLTWCRANKFELFINLKAAKALGIEVPETLLATADEVIQ